MKNKKVNTIITFVIVGIILLVGGIFFFLNYSSNGNSLTVLEKKWITDYTNKVVDVQIRNDIPIYGYNGSGIIFDFLDYFTEKYTIQFNKIPYYSSDSKKDGTVSFQVLNATEKISNQDILLYQDHYVVLSSNQPNHVSFSDFFQVGILKDDLKVLTNYFGKEKELMEYEDIDHLIKALENKEISYIVLPNMQSMAVILENQLDIVYHLSDLKTNYILRSSDKTLFHILKKCFSDYKNHDYEQNYSTHYLNVFFNSTKTTDLSRKNYNSKTYKYGYVVNMPFENLVNGNFVGTLSNYLNNFEKIGNVEIEGKRYETIDDLKSALVQEKVDFALGNFDYENLNMEHVVTSPIRDLNYVVLSKKNYTLNSIRGLKGKKVSCVANSLLHQLCKNYKIDVKTFSTTDDVLRNLDDQSIVLLDQETYLYYQNQNLKDYQLIYEGVLENEYRFLLNQKNEAFNSLFRYYVSTIDYHQIRYDYHTNISLNQDYTTFKIILFIIALILFLVSTILFINRKSFVNTVNSKEEKLKYIDPMTSLKNRSYLNLNIYKWDDNVIFPQSVLVFDLNDLRKVNDTYGREAGDEIIKKVASILINHQLENTDIIRSGGDEFLIYMVGYNEKEVSEYAKKLLREMKEIPNSLGIEVGYSMILDEVKTVDDAINEAILMMSKKKQAKKKEG